MSGVEIVPIHDVLRRLDPPDEYGWPKTDINGLELGIRGPYRNFVVAATVTASLGTWAVGPKAPGVFSPLQSDVQRAVADGWQDVPEILLGRLDYDKPVHGQQRSGQRTSRRNPGLDGATPSVAPYSPVIARPRETWSVTPASRL